MVIERARVAISENLTGQTLGSVTVLSFDIPDEDGPEVYEAICLHLESQVITIRALTDTSELIVNSTILSIPADPELNSFYSIKDISHHDSFRSLIGKKLRGWWSMTNDFGYNDGFMISFEDNSAVCVIAMNCSISILNVVGDQCS